MPIFQAIGLGVVILVLKLMAPAVYAEGEKTVLAFLHGAQLSATVASSLAASVGDIQISNTPLKLPVAQQIREP